MLHSPAHQCTREQPDSSQVNGGRPWSAGREWPPEPPEDLPCVQVRRTRFRPPPRKDVHHGKARRRRQGPRLHPARPGRQDGLARRTSPASAVVLYFYPRDDTPGCTKEACQFNDNLQAFAKAKVPVLGVSGDTAEKHRKFRAKYGLTFPLLTDADHAVGEAYGAWGEKTLYGKKSVGVIRSTFLIAADGTIARPWYHVKADGHAAKVLAEDRTADRRGHLRPGAPGTTTRSARPTVDRISSVPSLGQRPPRWRSSIRSPVWDPPRSVEVGQRSAPGGGGGGGSRSGSASPTAAGARARPATAARRR